jgi:hypothetical protein
VTERVKTTESRTIQWTWGRNSDFVIWLVRFPYVVAGGFAPRHLNRWVFVVARVGNRNQELWQIFGFFLKISFRVIERRKTSFPCSEFRANNGLGAWWRKLRGELERRRVYLNGSCRRENFFDKFCGFGYRSRKLNKGWIQVVSAIFFCSVDKD